MAMQQVSERYGRARALRPQANVQGQAAPCHVLQMPTLMPMLIDADAHAEALLRILGWCRIDGAEGCQCLCHASTMLMPDLCHVMFDSAGPGVSGWVALSCRARWAKCLCILRRSKQGCVPCLGCNALPG